MTTVVLPCPKSDDPRVDPVAFARMWEEWPAMLQEACSLGYRVNEDPFLTLDPEGIVCRYLIAEDNNVAAAAQRLRATLAWRREWNILEYHTKGIGHRLYAEESNPGAEMYFAVSGHSDKFGRPYMVGRGQLCNPGNMHPWRHLRAGIFAIEQLAVDVLRKGCGYGTYILDITGKVSAPGTFSGTGGGSNHRKDDKNNKYYKSGAGRDAPEALLKQFGELSGGMAVLRAALTIGSQHYPEFLARVTFLRSDFLFSVAFKVFRLWVHRRSRDKFVFLGGSIDPPIENLMELYPADELPIEFGGRGWSLEGDGFMRRGAEADCQPYNPAYPLAKALPSHAPKKELHVSDRVSSNECARNGYRDEISLHDPSPSLCNCFCFQRKDNKSGPPTSKSCNIELLRRDSNDRSCDLRDCTNLEPASTSTTSWSAFSFVAFVGLICVVVAALGGLQFLLS
eukprot:TRINITY_DN55444_c0_g1_i1.p1 TRINITY_DN55444_c0_g1~~TRINITY_DN55444_c0_g1_i1.p1  ORF type:complete len:452 (-),score=29.43 TRINITY_DN55444_c0_g1_i1:154-1509(-)